MQSSTSPNRFGVDWLDLAKAPPLDSNLKAKNPFWPCPCGRNLNRYLSRSGQALPRLVAIDRDDFAYSIAKLHCGWRLVGRKLTPALHARAASRENRIDVADRQR
jgi:hypothetical protein